MLKSKASFKTMPSAIDKGALSTICTPFVTDLTGQPLTHNDYGAVRNLLRELGQVDLMSVPLGGSELNRMFNGSVSVVDTHHTRLWQARWHEYEPHLEQIARLAAENGALMLNDLAMFRWNLDKAAYLSQLATQGVPMIPMHVVSPTSVAPDITELVNLYPGGVVIKPAQGMRARGVVFVRQCANGYERRWSTAPDGSDDQRPETATSQLGRQELSDWFELYRKTYSASATIVQERIIDAEEVSLVVIGSSVAAVLRTRGTESCIAHEAFGGMNIPLTAVPPPLLAFAEQVLAAMPPEVGTQQLQRIDAMVVPDTTNADPIILLLEIESAAPRLFLPETGRIGEFAAFLQSLASKTEPPQRSTKLFCSTLAALGEY